MAEIDVSDIKSRLREGRARLTQELIEALYKGGEQDFLKEFYPGPYSDWLETQGPDQHVEDVGDRELADDGKVDGHPDFIEVDRRIAADARR